MKCQVCGNDSGKYQLCYECNARRQKGDIVKCSNCGNWHFTNKSCETCSMQVNSNFIYELKSSLLSPIEKEYFDCIKTVLPEGYSVYPQINLASIINRTDTHTFQNELFRNVDFGVFDKNYKPIFLIEIQDKSHLNSKRKDRDQKIKMICEEAGIAIVEFWETNKVDPEKVKRTITDALEASPVERKAHHNIETEELITKEDNKPVSDHSFDLLKIARIILMVLSVLGFYYADSTYKETGETYQCLICALIPIATTVLGFFTMKKDKTIPAALVVGIIFTVLLLVYPFIYK